MVLVPEDNYKYLLSQSLGKEPLKTTQTIGSNLTRKDDEMHQILESNLPTDEKWKKYEQLFRQYMFFKNPVKTENVNTPSEAHFTDDEEKDNNALSNNKIIATLPKLMQRNGSNFLDFIKTVEDKYKITWDERGVVKVNKKEMPGSNIIDLVHDVVRKKHTFSAMDTDTFVQLLDDMGMPREFIGNVELHRALKGKNKHSFRGSEKSNNTLTKDSTFESYQSFLEGSSLGSTPKSTKKVTHPQKGSGWLSLNI